MNPSSLRDNYTELDSGDVEIPFITAENYAATSTFHTTAENPTHVLIKSYAADDERVAQRLLELCMLAGELVGF